MIRLRDLFRIDIPDDALVSSLTALPAARAVAKIAHREETPSLMLIDRGVADMRPIDEALVPGAAAARGPFDPVVLTRVGQGFVLVSPTGAARWRAFGDEPRTFARVDPFPKNKHGFTVKLAQGGVSDDPDAALLFPYEPQSAEKVTRYALLRFDERASTTRWEWVDGSGDPPFLFKEDFPIPDHWRSMSSFDGIHPRVDHGAWVSGTLRLFALGGLGSFLKWGMDYSIAAVIRDGRAVDQWACDEASWGRFASSGQYLILNPLRKNGPSKGRSHLLDLRTNELHALQLPRGFAGYTPVDHDGGTLWLGRHIGWECHLAACAVETA
jgi:hypothetical protein